jgi:hypothetical protein
MNSVVLGTLGLLGLLVLWHSVMVRHGNLGFWQVAARMPNEAFDWFRSDDTWIIVDPGGPGGESMRSRDDLVGPFKLAAPKAGGVVTVYADADRIEASQAAFMAAHGTRWDSGGPAWPSCLALAYPLTASMTFPAGSAGALEVLGYGLANLGYLLGAAGVVAGHFRALGLNYRIPTLLAAVAAWVAGTILVNIGG